METQSPRSLSTRTAKLCAHLTKVQAGYELRICPDMRPVGGYIFTVKGKRDARKIAAEKNAIAWNF